VMVAAGAAAAGGWRSACFAGGGEFALAIAVGPLLAAERASLILAGADRVRLCKIRRQVGFEQKMRTRARFG